MQAHQRYNWIDHYLYTTMHQMIVARRLRLRVILNQPLPLQQDMVGKRNRPPSAIDASMNLHEGLWQSMRFFELKNLA